MQQRSETLRAEFVPLGGDRRGFYAVPVGTGPFPAVLVFQEAFGVNEYIQSEVRRLAEHGYAALAPDLFRGDTYGYDEFPKIQPRLQTLTNEVLLADVDASLAFLDGQREVKKDRYGAVGFCMGGRLAVLAALSRPERIAATSSFYGGAIAPQERRHFTPLIDHLESITAELLLIYGADDQSIVPKEHATIAERLSSLKKRYTLTVYPGAGHGFASRDRESYRPRQAEDAWAQTLALFDRALRSAS